MGRPAKFDRDEAVQAAMNLFWKHGYQANSVKALAESLGITRSSLYNTFRSREALFRAALDRYFAESPDRRLATPLSGVPVKCLLTELFREICRVRAADPEGRGCMALNCLSETVSSDNEIGALIAGAVLGMVDRVEHLLADAVARGELPPDTDVHTLALAVQNLIIGLNHFSKVLRSENELWSVARTTLGGLGLLEEQASRSVGLRAAKVTTS